MRLTPIRKGAEQMRDDAIYCEYPDGAEMAYIPFWRHEKIMYHERQKQRRLIMAIGALALALIAAIIIR